MKILTLLIILTTSACSSMNQPADTTPQNVLTNTHVQNDTGHPCSIGDTRRGSCY